MPYEQRLKAVKAIPLEIRRVVNDLILYYKIIHKYVDIPLNEFFLFNTRKSRGHPLTLLKPKFVNNLERYSFKIRAINLWNNLPEFIVNSPNVNCFKNRLRKVDLVSLIRKSRLNES